MNGFTQPLSDSGYLQKLFRKIICPFTLYDQNHSNRLWQQICHRDIMSVVFLYLEIVVKRDQLKLYKCLSQGCINYYSHYVFGLEQGRPAGLLTLSHSSFIMSSNAKWLARPSIKIEVVEGVCCIYP